MEQDDYRAQAFYVGSFIPGSLVWPESFKTGQIEYDIDNLPEDMVNRALCADAMIAWGNVMFGATPPEHFGKVMVQIASRLGIPGTPESFIEYSKRFDTTEDDK